MNTIKSRKAFYILVNQGERGMDQDKLKKLPKIDKTKLLKAFGEEYEWTKSCINEMKEKPNIYTEIDHCGLPYAFDILNSILEASIKQ